MVVDGEIMVGSQMKATLPFCGSPGDRWRRGSIVYACAGGLFGRTQALVAVKTKFSATLY